MPGLYVHIPFCRHKCIYCDFYSVARSDKTEAFLDALLQEAVQRKNYFGQGSIYTVYIGGGSPGVLNALQINKMFTHLGDIFDLSKIKECTIELNPEDALPEYLETLLQIKATRISIGVQSTHTHLLQLLGRRHSAGEALQALQNIRKAGFTNISADIMFGIPGLKLGELTESIERIVDLGVSHISVYLLTAEGNTLLTRRVREGRIVMPDDSECHTQYETVCSILQRSGFEHYEISNFAKPGFRSIHNSAYWSGEKYLGLGPSAHSYDGHKIRSANIADIHSYIENINMRNMAYTEENLSDTDLINECIMTRLRTSAGIDLNAFESVYGEFARSTLLKQASSGITRGHLNIRDTQMYIPEEKMLISDAIISELFQ